MEAAVQATYQVVRNLHKAIAADEDTLVPFTLAGKTKLEEKDVEYGIVRLIHLGVVSGYLKDYNRRIFRVDVTTEWLQIARVPAALAEHLPEPVGAFMRRYPLVAAEEQVTLLRSDRIPLSAASGTGSPQIMTCDERP